MKVLYRYCGPNTRPILNFAKFVVAKNAPVLKPEPDILSLRTARQFFGVLRPELGESPGIQRLPDTPGQLIVEI